MRCSASSPESETRLSFLHKSAVGVAAAAAAVSFGSPLIALADDEGEVKVGEEVTSDSGLKYVVTKAGTGAKPNPGDFVKAHYTGALRVFLLLMFRLMCQISLLLLPCSPVSPLHTLHLSNLLARSPREL